MVSTLAARLAFAVPTYGTKLAAALRKDPDLINSALSPRFQGMIAEPIRAIGKQVPTSSLVVVIDALDECGTAETRTRLVSLLLELSKVARWIKIIMTSRPNDELMGLLRNQGNEPVRRDLFKEDLGSVTSDITLFIHHSLKQVQGEDESLAGTSWLHDTTVEDLAARANGLFIWARTACSMIRHSLNPEEQVKELLAGNASHDASEQLNSLYGVVLAEALGETRGKPRVIKSCISAVITTRIPLSDATLSKLVPNVGLTELQNVIRRLASVLYRDQSGLVRVVHQSFSDYMVDEKCDEKYRINKEEENLAVATSCLRIMNKELRFNICELEDSTVYNDQISDLPCRIQKMISPQLQYSCIYWASHLAETLVFNIALETHEAAIQQLADILLSPRVLFWIEVLSLVKQLNGGESSLLEVMDWVKVRLRFYLAWSFSL